MDLALVCDELTAVGWRLAGVPVHVPRRAAVTAAESWQQARGSAKVVLITAALAAALPPEELAAALAASQPLVGVIPDVRHRHEPADVEEQVHRALGML
jgi:vacuolar-type H+-ATPase subunit F/Vma7